MNWKSFIYGSHKASSAVRQSSYEIAIQFELNDLLIRRTESVTNNTFAYLTSSTFSTFAALSNEIEWELSFFLVWENRSTGIGSITAR